MTMPTVVSNSGGPSAGSLVVASAGPSGRGGSGSSPSGSSSSSSRPSGPSGPGGDELGPSSDEVKVFQNEGEDDRDKSDSGNLQADLLEEESSLITESEQEKSRRDGFAGFGFGSMSPYLFGSYAAAAYANGSHLARSPYLYGDPLSSPPPAHMGTYLDKAGVAGLRPPLYGLPPHAAAAAAAGYPYHMLGADQLAAWHHQAAYGLRPGSPYSLPITSTSLSSMSRFSPTGFLSHPGLAAAVAAGSPVGAGVHGQHLPQHMKQEYGHSRGSHHHSDKDLLSPSKASKRDSHIKKPLNAFMLYMKEMRPVVQAECTLKESAAINQILGRRWHGLSRDEQAKYYEKARAERQKHMQMYPHWNARDNYRFGLKKKKRKRDKADDPASSMKKCRARFGLDQQDLWCKPCRRKKKCIRVQVYLEGKSAAAAAASAASSGSNSAGSIGNNGSSSGTGPGSHLHHPFGDGSNGFANLRNYSHGGSKPHSNGLGNPGGPGSGNKDHFHSDGEDDDDESPGEASPMGLNGPASVESTSEPSLRSPAGFHSLPSIGSPGGSSIASPSTPSSSSLTTSNYDNPMASFLASDWFSRASAVAAAGGGAFKPPAYFHHMPQRAAVGRDPKDSNHPLSVTQLTGGGGSCTPAASENLVGPPHAPPSADKRPPLLSMT
ncbi:protein pangolin, isoforms A/H/I/S-like isoform X2 [Tigriopus californicus]|uniref:protein pangolin, isoforms A/H/I/S-like isoform X2 n=1 Tax=Tigriopus californicus TaxID=6832 RepID=UPI0027D9EDED|nr:protein pangolin, isoforms A/H/I/S-like isoform X2 [Tigriopus californicus]